MKNSWIIIPQITCQRNLTPLPGKQIVTCIILGRKKSEIYIKMHASLVFQGLECVDLKERNINRCMISEKIKSEKKLKILI